jgi:hypothetical protein
MRRPKRNHSAAFKALDGLVGILGRARIADDGREQIRELREKVGELTMERDFLSCALGNLPGLNCKR